MLRLGSARSYFLLAGGDSFQVRSAAISLAAWSVNENAAVVICVAEWDHRGKVYHYRIGSVVEYTVHSARCFREGAAGGIYVERCPAPFIFGEGSADDCAPNRPRVEMPGKGLSGGEGDLKHRDDPAVWERDAKTGRQYVRQSFSSASCAAADSPCASRTMLQCVVTNAAPPCCSLAPVAVVEVTSLGAPLTVQSN
jgi:hypothetical protein